MTNETTTKKSSRPTEVGDLPDYQLLGDRIADVAVAMFADDADMLGAYSDLVRAAKAAGHVVSSDGEIRRAVTDELLQRRLADAQASWDRAETAYLEALGTGVVKDGYAWAVKEWCKKEGREYPVAGVS
ncbi:hypothetical protein DEU38_103136 [Rhodococcus sp. AG1013]|uniref:DUF7432 family protein n=1 Tax=Rhodococcus sp. AG1013 TaxID=2183996 RepID=UPI000E0C7BD9|nr:hypothetical protein [Rhodococcus sp. AG1013]RDI32403.1 hypothetical protein DEU38_103136 [Rhodococcus sp. AG1013]